jgi:alanyl-tRNA synthetase
MDINDIRDLYKGFYISKGHLPLPSASIIPEVQNGVLFTTAGMHPLVPYLSGERKPPSRRLTNAQKVIRTTDIDEVGDSTHTTAFEMLGNWSIGDYGKKETIEMSYEFLTGRLGLGTDNFWVTVFGGNDSLPRDDESAAHWKRLGVPEERIVFLKGDANWWAMAEDGLCGPCTEMHIDTQPGKPVGPGSRLGDDPENRFIEVGNNVFMNYVRENGALRELAHSNVDVGLGLERLAVVSSGLSSIYELPVYRDAFRTLLQSSPLTGDEVDADPALTKARRIVLDHAKAALFIIGDAQTTTEPSNKGAGYIVRRLIRSMTYHSQALQVTDNAVLETMDVFANYYKQEYPAFSDKLPVVKDIVAREQANFHRSLNKGMKYLEKEIRLAKANGAFGSGGQAELPADRAFFMLETHGFPVDLTKAIVAEHGLGLDLQEVGRIREEHRAMSRLKSDRPPPPNKASNG